MKTPIVVLASNVSVVVFCAASPISANRVEVTDRILAIAHDRHIHLNESAFSFATELIEQRRFLADLRNAWGEHQPSTEEENEFIRQHGFAEYAKWHLGIDDRHAENTKARYKFPFGDFKNIHRSALLAAKSRARQYGYSDIEDAVNRLLEMIESKEKHHRTGDRPTEPVPLQAVKNASISSGKSSL